MLCLFVLFPLLFAPLSALSLPSNPSIIQLPANDTTSSNLLQDAEWPEVPWTYRDFDKLIAIDFITYGRLANINLSRKIVSDLDTIILILLHQDEYGSAPIVFARGIVRVTVIYTRTGVRTTSVALALQQIRDLMGYKYGPREIGQASIAAAGTSESFAMLEVVFDRM